jgi:predicted nucleic acid-binding protein
MRTAVDTSVLLAIAKTEADADAWIRLLAQERESGELLVCDIVAAEYYASILDEEKFTQTLRRLGLRYAPCETLAAMMAGAIFRRYRNEGGPREHLIPDFLVGAHAATQADQIAAKDRGFLRKYFPRLKAIHP